MVSLAGVLVLLTIAVHLPVHEPEGRVGWTVTNHSEPIHISEFEMTETSASDEASSASMATVPPTQFDRPVDDDRAESESVSEANNDPEEGGEDDTPRFARNLRAVDSADEAPRMVGGEGSLYLRIHYPEKAREQGIEGRLVLRFIVDQTGHPRNIAVAEPLHALLDSAAVRALRETRFVPARQDGKRVPVRMNLPVRFKLLNNATDAVADNSNGEKE